MKYLVVFTDYFLGKSENLPDRNNPFPVCTDKQDFLLSFMFFNVIIIEKEIFPLKQYYLQ